MTVSNTSSQPTPTESFVLKSTSVSMPILELRTTNLNDIESALLAKVASAPAFFKRCPIVFNLQQLADDDFIDLKSLYSLCRQQGFLPMGIQGDYPVYDQDLMDLGLATFAKGKIKFETDPAPVVVSAPEPVQVPPEVIPETITIVEQKNSTTKVVSTPIRSGQQIYSSADMIILSSVSAGAEVLAEGNIHIYGALRGRALAGVKGDESARIFCQSQEAELMSIAGRFMIDEDLRTANWREPVQASLNGDKLNIEILG